MEILQFLENVNNANLYFQTTGYGDTYGLNVQDTLGIISYTFCL